jgi:hypothetical protein
MPLTDTDLEFARAHLSNYYASDFLPDPGELHALWARWDDVVAYHRSKPIAEMGSLAREFAAPKANGGYRIVHQLDPLDAVTYTALAHQIAPFLERARAPIERGIACSYRIALDSATGRFFAPDNNGYRVFSERSEDLSSSYSHVLQLDIAGFYNHIYVHRVQSVTEELDASLPELSTSLEQFLLNVNKRVSIGIPVGPAASIVFAEAVLTDIDRFIVTREPYCPYTRYVDDLRIFSDERDRLERLWHDLSRYLYRSHRLSLATDKSRILGTSEFRDHVLHPPDRERRQSLAKQLGLSLDDLAADYASQDLEPPFEKPSPEQHRRLLRKLMEDLLSTRPLPIGLARRVLREARAKRIRAIFPLVLRNVGALMPIVRDVGLYLDKVLSPRAISRNASLIEETLQLYSDHCPELLREWLGWLITRHSSMAGLPAARQFIDSSPLRFKAAAAAVMRNTSWVRENSAQWSHSATEDRWALLRSGALLPGAERRVWMDHVLTHSGDPVDGIVARYVRGL